MYKGHLTDVAGLLVGHYTDKNAKTGCTAILAPKGAVGGVDVRGGAPGTKETDAFSPGGIVPKVHGVTLCGGSAFGLDAAQGVMNYLHERDIGFEAGHAIVPLVAGAVIYDLDVGDSTIRPTAQNGYFAAKHATSNAEEMGLVGAGTGATVGKMMGPQFAQSGGIGSSSIKLNGATIAAMFAVNALGNIYNYQDGTQIAGAYDIERQMFLPGIENAHEQAFQNTTIGVIATDAKLTKLQAQRLAMLAHDGLAMAIRPVHLPYDGDTTFALATGQVEANVDEVFAHAAIVTARAIYNAVKAGREI